MQLNNLTALEMSLCAGMITSPEVLMSAMQVLQPHDFYLPECRKIYEAVLTLFSKGIPIDPITATDELGGNKSEWRVFLASCAKELVSTANHKAHIRIILESSQRRQAKQVLIELHESIDVAADISFLREQASTMLKVFDDLATAEDVSAADGYNNFIASIGKPKEYVRTGISSLDHYVKMSKGDFVCVGGRPSSGKTALTLQLMLSIAQRQNVVFFSLETTAEKLFERLISSYTSVSFDDVKQGTISAEQLKNIRSICVGRFDKLNFTIVKASGWSTEQIRSKALQLKADVIFIDYLGLIKPSSGKSQYEKVTQTSIELHTMAQVDKILVVSVVQLNRLSNGGEPDMTSLRDSGQIEQDADVILLLHTPDDNEKHHKTLTIAKNKEGLQGKIEFDFAGEIQKFRVIQNHVEPTGGKK